MRANAEAYTPYKCEGCDVAHQVAWSCPDLGLRKDEPILADGVSFDQCPGYWKRFDQLKWGRLPHMIDVRSAYEIAGEMRQAVEHGAILPSALPGKLHDGLSMILSIDAAKIRRDIEARKGGGSERERLI